MLTALVTISEIQLVVRHWIQFELIITGITQTPSESILPLPLNRIELLKRRLNGRILKQRIQTVHVSGICYLKLKLSRLLPVLECVLWRLLGRLESAAWERRWRLRLLWRTAAARGQPDSDRCEVRPLLTWPRPVQPGVGHFTMVSWSAKTVMIIHKKGHFRWEWVGICSIEVGCSELVSCH